MPATTGGWREEGGGLPLTLMIADGLAHVSLRAALAIFGQAALGSAYDGFWADPRFADALNCPGYRSTPALWTRQPGADYAVLLATNASLAKAPDPAAALRQARAPTLILHGDCDFIPRADAADYAATLPDARIIDIAGAGHAAADAKSDDVMALLSGFLQEN